MSTSVSTARRPRRPTFGIIGGGQLARMMVPPAKRLGFDVAVLDPTPGAPAAQLADHHVVGAFDDAAALRRLAERSDVITYDLEHVDTDILEGLAAAGHRLRPEPHLLALVQDKGRQRRFFAQRGLPGPRFEVLVDAPTPEQVAAFGGPVMQKARWGGYDGRGVRRLADAHATPMPVPSLLEACVPIDLELGVMVARGEDGAEAVWPPVEMTFDSTHMLDALVAPARIPRPLRLRAEDLAAEVVDALGGVGVFGVELFLTPNGELLVNEVAPRPHNSGHYTIEASVTDQLEQHVRAVAGLPLGSTALLTPAVTVNLAGVGRGPACVTGLAEALALPGVAVHLYGKDEARPGRKMGHVTAVDADVEAALERAHAARDALRVEGSHA